MKRLILVGAGHAHAQVLKKLTREPLQDVETIVVSPHGLAPYSGMVPGWLAGQYAFKDISIDFARLSKAAGAKWIQAHLHSLDPDDRRLSLSLHPDCPFDDIYRNSHDSITPGHQLTEIDYDVLSLNVGSTLYPPSPNMLALRPLANLRASYDQFLMQWHQSPSSTPDKLTMVGAGPAGVETLLALRTRLQAINPCKKIVSTLVTRSEKILPELNRMTRWLARRHLDNVSVVCRCDTSWEAGMESDNELVLWATGAQAHDWQRKIQRRGTLAVSDSHFIRIDPTLRSVSHPSIFATGDCAHWSDALPKAGVYAVRMGAVLCNNLYASMGQGTMKHYEPQTQFLALLNTADGGAIASRGAFAAKGRWAMRWKDRIDRHFVEQFS